MKKKKLIKKHQKGSNINNLWTPQQNLLTGIEDITNFFNKNVISSVPPQRTNVGLLTPKSVNPVSSMFPKQYSDTAKMFQPGGGNLSGKGKGLFGDMSVENKGNLIGQAADLVGIGLEAAGVKRAETMGTNEENLMKGLNIGGKTLLKIPGLQFVGGAMLAAEAINKYVSNTNKAQGTSGIGAATNMRGYKEITSLDAGKKNSFYEMITGKKGKTDSQTFLADKSNVLKANASYQDSRNQLSANYGDTLAKNDRQRSGGLNTGIVSSKKGGIIKFQVGGQSQWTKNSIKYYTDWLSNRKTQLAENIGNINNVENELNSQKNNVNTLGEINAKNINSTMYPISNTINTKYQPYINDNNALGAYISELHAVSYKPQSYTVNDREVNLHEVTHGAIKNNISPQVKKINSIITNRKSDYLDSPFEIYPRLMEFRNLNKIDPLKQYNLDDIKQFRVSPNIKDTELLNRYDDNQMLKLLNDVAQNKSTSQTPLQFAKKGGNINPKKLSNIKKKALYKVKKAQEGSMGINVTTLALGGKVNIIPEGALHARKNNYEGDLAEQVTSKGIPVISYEEGDKIVQHAEVECNEIIYNIDTTKQLEAWFKEYNETEDTKKKAELEIECGKFLVEEILENTLDKTNLIESIE